MQNFAIRHDSWFSINQSQVYISNLDTHKSVHYVISFIKKTEALMKIKDFLYKV